VAGSPALETEKGLSGDRSGRFLPESGPTLALLPRTHVRCLPGFDCLLLPGGPLSKTGDWLQRPKRCLRVDATACPRFSESIAESFPTLTLEQVYGAIAFYLANQPIVDQYLREGERLSREMQVESRRRNAGLITRLQRVPHESQIPG